MNVEIGTESAQFIVWESINSTFFALHAFSLVRAVVGRSTVQLLSNPHGFSLITEMAR
jgi:hypothetical protein